MNALLIDMGSLAHPIYHMSGNDPNPDATSIKIVERVRALATGQPHVAICCDAGRSFRHDISADYKAQRPESEATLQHQIAIAIETLKGDGFPVWLSKGFEADDLLASATAQIRYDPSCTVTMATADKDLLQLVTQDDAVTVHSLRDGSTVDWDAVYVKFGVYPSQVKDFLALVGDASDNIKGAKGIGAKRAAELLSKYGSLDGVFKELDTHGTKFTPALATALREFQPRLPTVRELLTLRTDVPLPIQEIWRPRVPINADLAVFGEDHEMPVADDLFLSRLPSPEQVHKAHELITADLEEAMPTVQHMQDAAMESHRPEEAAMPTLRQEAAADLSASPLPPPSASPAEIVTVAAGNGKSALPSDWERQLEPRSMTEAKQLSVDMFASRMFSAYGNAPAVLATILAGRELGIQAMASLRAFHIIEGKPTLSADLIRALVMKSGKAKFFRVVERTAHHATWETQRDEDPPVRLTFTIDEGRQAFSGDDKKWAASGWGKNPADLLTARASSKLARLVYADVVFNIYSDSEFD